MNLDIKVCFAVVMSVLSAVASERPIGVFDSGTGGLTVLEKLLTVDEFDNETGVRRPDGKPDLDSENFVYFGDQANMPYGLYDAKGKVDFLRELIVRDTEFVLGSDGHAPSKIVVIACNTATAYGLSAATEAARPKGAEVIGVVNAGVEAAMDALDVKAGMEPFAVGVIATPGTIASGVYERTLRSALAARNVGCCDIINRGGVGLAEAVENDEPGMKDCARTNLIAMVESYRLRGGSSPIRAVILGCTHYPFVLDVFKRTLTELKRDPKYSSLIAGDLVFVDPAVYTAVQCCRALRKAGILNRKDAGSPRVRAFMSVGRDGPLSMEVKYGRSTGAKDIGTVIVPMNDKNMSADAVKRLRKLLPESSREIFGAAAFAARGRTGCDNSLRVGTYNIRMMRGDSGTANAWDGRKSDLVEEIRRLDMDVFGMQEVFPLQSLFITNALPQYAVTGEYREKDRVSGEASPVCYKKDRFDVVSSGTFWLSETPDVPGVKGWGAACPRVCTWALLKDRRTGAMMTFANTHTDHRSALARKEGMLLVIRRMRQFAPKGTPIVFTGDHNCRETEEPAIAVSEILNDALYASKTPPKGPWRTFNGWRWRDSEYTAVDALKLPKDVRNMLNGSAGNKNDGGREQVGCGSRIDYIYVSKDVTVRSFETHAAPRPGTRLYPSDHFPVTADILLPASK